MKKNYQVHPDFKLANIIHAPTDPVGVTALNYLNQRGIERIEPGTKLTIETIEIQSKDGTFFEAYLIRYKNSQGLLPCYIHVHGGGFMLKASSVLVKNMMEYAERLKCSVLLPDYRLLPEFPFPKGFEDVCSAVEWVAKEGHLHGLDAQRMVVGGDSAGGALAAGAAIYARDLGGPKLLGQILIYPVTDYTQSSESLATYWDAPVWDAKKNQSMWEKYLVDELSEVMIGYASPLNCMDLEDLPRAYIEVAEFDCLRDEGIAYANALEAAGNKVILYEVEGGVHGYDNFMNSAHVDTYVNKRIKLLKKLFSSAITGIG